MTDAVENTIVYLIRKERFYAEILRRMTKIYTTDIDTIGVAIDLTGPLLFINPYFLTNITDNAERADILKHECEHLMRGHFDREKTLEPSLYKKTTSIVDRYKQMSTAFILNIAEDAAINCTLKHLPKQFKLYDKKGNPLVDENGEIEYFAPVSIPDLRTKLKKDDLQDKQAMEYYYSFLKQHSDQLKDSPGPKMIPLDDHSMLKKGIDNLDPEFCKQVVQKLVNEAYESLDSKDKGSLPDHVKILIDKLNRANKDWRDDVQQFHTQCYFSEQEETRKRRNRRYGLAYPGRRIKNITHLAVCLDMSASVLDHQAKQFFSELVNIHDTGTKITVIECDATIQRVYEFDPNSQFGLTGRGGTLFKPAFDLIESDEFVSTHGKVDGLIYFTDGGNSDRDLQQPNFNVLWALLPGCRVDYDWGRRTHIEVLNEQI